MAIVQKASGGLDKELEDLVNKLKDNLEEREQLKIQLKASESQAPYGDFSYIKTTDIESNRAIQKNQDQLRSDIDKCSAELKRAADEIKIKLNGYHDRKIHFYDSKYKTIELNTAGRPYFEVVVDGAVVIAFDNDYEDFDDFSSI